MSYTEVKNQLRPMVALMALFLAGVGLSLAQTATITSGDVQITTSMGETPVVSIAPDFSSKLAKFWGKLSAQADFTQDTLAGVNKRISETNGKIVDVKEKMDSLKGQLKNLDDQVEKTQGFIDNVEVQLAKKQAEIDEIEYKLEKNSIEISFQKGLVSDYMVALYKDQSLYNQIDANGIQLNPVKLLLANESVSENLRTMRYSEVLQKQSQDAVNKLSNLIQDDDRQRKLNEIKKVDLAVMQKQLEDEKADLSATRQAKENLLEQTKGEEQIYQQLLERSKAQQLDVIQQIDTLRKNMVFVKERMKAMGSDFNPDDYSSLFNFSVKKDFVNFLGEDDGSGIVFDWPVNPLRGISAYFRDSSYVKVFGMRHNAIDIRIPQDTPIMAPADGVVYKSVDNGYGYSYIMLAHKNGYMTLYGHVTDIMVSVGDEVKTGDVIGLSGGVPGTKGAGVYTTGAHLHFEIIKDGIYVDPLDYLNLAVLQMDLLPEKYVAKALGDRQKVKRIPEKPKVKNYNNFVHKQDEEQLAF